MRGEGLCIGTGGVIDVCKELFTREECAEYDDQAVNGSDWEFARGSYEARPARLGALRGRRRL